MTQSLLSPCWTTLGHRLTPLLKLLSLPRWPSLSSLPTEILGTLQIKHHLLRVDPPLTSTQPSLFSSLHTMWYWSSQAAGVCVKYFKGSFLFLFVPLKSNTGPGMWCTFNTSLFYWIQCFPKRWMNNTEGRKGDLRFPYSELAAMLNHTGRKWFHF